MLRILRITSSTCCTLAALKANLLRAVLSSMVSTLAETILTPASEMVVVMSFSRCILSRASTSSSTVKSLSEPLAHSTSTKRSGSLACSAPAFTQPAEWTTTPRPKETYPTISSPGIGVQQRASRVLQDARGDLPDPALLEEGQDLLASQAQVVFPVGLVEELPDLLPGAPALDHRQPVAARPRVLARNDLDPVAGDELGVKGDDPVVDPGSYRAVAHF